MQDENDWNALCELIRSGSDRRFVLLSRGAPPGCPIVFRYTGLMTVLGVDDLLFDREDARRLLHSYGVEATEGELTAILRESAGSPLGIAVTARGMSGGKPFSPEVAPFESFDLEMARMVSGNSHAGELLDWLQRSTTMLRYDDLRRFHFWPQFRVFLLWEMEREYTDEKRRALFSRGGLYYELREDYSHALDCYAKGGDHAKVSELLIRNAELHPGMGHYSEMEKYYRALPEAEVLASPSLMQGMSMLCALAADYAGSERRYQALVRFADRCSGQDAARVQAQSRLAWLDISLTDRDHPRRIPSAARPQAAPSAVFRHQRSAEHHERRQGLFRVEPKGRPALQDAPRPRGGCARARRRRSC